MSQFPNPNLHIPITSYQGVPGAQPFVPEAQVASTSQIAFTHTLNVGDPATPHMQNALFFIGEAEKALYQHTQAFAAISSPEMYYALHFVQQARQAQTALDAIVQALQQTIAELQNQINHSNYKLEVQNPSLLAENIVNLQADIKKKNEEILQLKDLVENKKVEMENLQREKGSLQSLQGVNKNLSQEKKDLQNQLQIKTEELERIQERLDEKKGEAQSVFCEKDAKIQKVREDSANVQKALNHQLKQIKRKNDDLNAVLQKRNEEIQNLHISISDAEKIKKNQDEKINSLNKDIHLLNEKLIDKENALEKAQEELRKAQTEQKAAQAELKKLQTELGKVKLSLQSLTDKHRNAQEKLCSLENQKNQLEQSEKEKNTTTLSLEREIKSLNKKIIELGKELEPLTQEIQYKNEKIKDLEEKLSNKKNISDYEGELSDQEQECVYELANEELFREKLGDLLDTDRFQLLKNIGKFIYSYKEKYSFIVRGKYSAGDYLKEVNNHFFSYFSEECIDSIIALSKKKFGNFYDIKTEFLEIHINVISYCIKSLIEDIRKMTVNTPDGNTLMDVYLVRKDILKIFQRFERCPKNLAIYCPPHEDIGEETYINLDQYKKDAQNKIREIDKILIEASLGYLEKPQQWFSLAVQGLCAGIEKLEKLEKLEIPKCGHDFALYWKNITNDISMCFPYIKSSSHLFGMFLSLELAYFQKESFSEEYEKHGDKTSLSIFLEEMEKRRKIFNEIKKVSEFVNKEDRDHFMKRLRAALSPLMELKKERVNSVFHCEEIALDNILTMAEKNPKEENSIAAVAFVKDRLQEFKLLGWENILPKIQKRCDAMSKSSL